MTEPSSSPRPPWKLLATMLALPWLCVLLFKHLPALDTYSYLATFIQMVAVFLSLILVLVWLLLFSNFHTSRRQRGCFAILASLVAMGLLVRKDGHMGDFLPQLSWRWQSRPGENLATLAPTADAAGLKFTTDEPTDSPVFLGKTGLNFEPAPQLAKDWYTRTPRELWRREVGLGWSGFCIAGDFLVTQEQRGEQELTVAYNKTTGQPIWNHAETANFQESMGGNGPRSTPTAHAGNIYALGATGILVCLEGTTGKLLWRRQTLEEAGHTNLMWAKSNSPVIFEDKVIVTLGTGEKAVAAYFLATGEPAWRAGNSDASYATPIIVQRAGKPELINIFAESAMGMNPTTGKPNWEWNTEAGFKKGAANVANPIFIAPDRVIIAIGYGVGSTMLKLPEMGTTEGKPEILWQTIKMKPKFTNLAIGTTHAWGLDEGRLSCLDLATGEQAWRGASYGHGQLLGAGNTLIIQHERGEVVVVEASTTEEKVLATFPALTSKTWNQPCLAGTTLYVRNDREMIAFQLNP